MSAAPVRAESPLVGLRRRSVGQVEVLAQSVSVTAPTAAMATAPALVAASAGRGTLVAYGVAILVVGLLTVAVRQFASRLAAPGSLYTYVAKGLGAVPAVAAAAALAVGYAVLTMATIVLASWYLLDLGAALGGRVGAALASPSVLVGGGTVLMVGALVTGCLVRGITTSSRVALAVEGVAVLLVLGVIVAVVVAVVPGGAEPVVPPGADAPGVGSDPVRGWSVLAPALDLGGLDLRGVLHGAALAVASFIGFESAASLGAEARRPLLTVPRAVGWTVVVVSALYLVSALVQLVALGPSLGTRSEPLIDLASATGSTSVSMALDLAVACSGFACALGSATALARLLFSRARERGADARLGATDPRSNAPHNAIVASMTVVVGVPLVLVLAGAELRTLFAALLTVSTVGYLVAYVLVCAALPAFLGRIGELTSRTAVVGSVGAVALATLLVGFAVPGAPGAALGGVDTPWSLPLVLVVVAGALARHLAAVRRDPLHANRIGLYDEPVLADLHPSHRLAHPSSGHPEPPREEGWP